MCSHEDSRGWYEQPSTNRTSCSSTCGPAILCVLGSTPPTISASGVPARDNPQRLCSTRAGDRSMAGGQADGGDRAELSNKPPDDLLVVGQKDKGRVAFRRVPSSVWPDPRHLAAHQGEGTFMGLQVLRWVA